MARSASKTWPGHSPEPKFKKKALRWRGGRRQPGIGVLVSIAQSTDTPLFDALASSFDLPSIHSVTLVDEPRARATDLVTSHEAADSISGEAREASELFALEQLRAYGVLTDGDVFDLAQISGHKWSPSRLRTARAQLVSKGLVRGLDHEGRSASGRRMTRWAVA